VANAISVQLAEEIVTELNRDSAQSKFSQEFTATRSYAPVFKREDMSQLHVTVVPKSQTQELMTRGSNSEDNHDVFIGVQKAVDPDSLLEIDALTKLTEEIKDHFLGDVVIEGSEFNTTVTAAVIDPIAEPDFLTTKHQFLSLVTLTMFVFK